MSFFLFMEEDVRKSRYNIRRSQCHFICMKKFRVCVELEEQVFIGLVSKDSSNFLISRTHFDEYRFYHDTVDYERVAESKKMKAV